MLDLGINTTQHIQIYHLCRRILRRLQDHSEICFFCRLCASLHCFDRIDCATHCVLEPERQRPSAFWGEKSSLG